MSERLRLYKAIACAFEIGSYDWETLSKAEDQLRADDATIASLTARAEYAEAALADKLTIVAWADEGDLRSMEEERQALTHLRKSGGHRTRSAKQWEIRAIKSAVLRPGGESKHFIVPLYAGKPEQFFVMTEQK